MITLNYGHEFRLTQMTAPEVGRYLQTIFYKGETIITYMSTVKKHSSVHVCQMLQVKRFDVFAQTVQTTASAAM